MKLQDLQDCLQRNGVDAGLFFSRDWSPNIQYLSGYEGSGWLIVPRRKNPTLIVPPMEQQRAERTGLPTIAKKGPLNHTVRDFLRTQGIGRARIGITRDTPWSTTHDLTSWGLSLTDISPIMDELRAIKTKQELDILKDGCRLTDSLIQQSFKHWDSFATESDVAAFFEFEAARKGHSTSFRTIVASGPHAGIPHHTPSPLPLEPGFCIIDTGIRYKGYCTDMSRTICIGTPSPTMKQHYNAVLNAQEHAIAAVKDGMACTTLDRQARASLKQLSSYFIHGLGHGIGIEVHEQPLISTSSPETLKTNMCITIEPGIYTHTGGIRIEDDLIVMRQGARVLTKAPKELIVMDCVHARPCSPPDSPKMP